MPKRRWWLLGGLGMFVIAIYVLLFGPWNYMAKPIPIQPQDRLPDYPNAMDTTFWGSTTRGHDVYWGIESIELTQTTIFSTTDSIDQILTFYRTYAEQTHLDIQESSSNGCSCGSTASHTPELTLIRLMVNQKSMQSGYAYTIRILPTIEQNWQRVEIQQHPQAMEIFNP